MQIKQKIDSFIDSIKADTNWIFVGNDCSRIGQNNMVIFPINVTELSSEHSKIAVDALLKCEKVMGEKWGDIEYIFYCWFDGMASQLRFSSVPKNCKLPFGCQLSVANNIEDIIHLSMNSLHSLVWGELEEIEFDESNKEGEIENTQEYVLDVYVKYS